MEDEGEEIVHKYIGREPSGVQFNALQLDKTGKLSLKKTKQFWFFFFTLQSFKPNNIQIHPQNMNDLQNACNLKKTHKKSTNVTPIQALSLFIVTFH